MNFLPPDTFAKELRDTGVLLQSPSLFGDKVFYCRYGFRHWVRDGAWIKSCGFHWPDDVINVPPAVLSAFRPSGSVGHFWPVNTDPGSIRSSLDMREFVASRLVGIGLEVGAGASPFPVPLSCRVMYGDRLSYDELLKESYPGQEMSDVVMPDIYTDANTFSGVVDESLDFVIGCHVIEHVRDPIGSIGNAWRKLRKGGRLLLVVPDMERTFDRARSISSLEHIVEDYRNPDLTRDLPHYEEFYRLAFPTPPEQYAALVAKKFEEQYLIHFHVWTYTSFGTLISYISDNVTPWSEVWSHATLKNKKDNIEFYFVLTK